MADRPAQICQLKKGQLICDQQGFVDTFNWAVQAIDNLTGGENCEVSWPLPDHPTIDVTVDDDESGGGGGVAGVNIHGNDGSETGIQDEFYLKSGSDSHVGFSCDGQDIYVGVYYI